MKTFYFILTTVFLLTASSELNAQTRRAATPRYLVTHNSFGKVKVGMTAAEASKALGVRLIWHVQNLNECYYAFPRRGFKNVSFMMDNRRIARIDIDGKEYATDRGAKIGDSVEKIKRLYKGMYEIGPHKYVENGHYIEIKTRDGKYNLLFETDGKRVTSFRAGRSEEVGLVERCG